MAARPRLSPDRSGGAWTATLYHSELILGPAGLGRRLLHGVRLHRYPSEPVIPGGLTARSASCARRLPDRFLRVPGQAGHNTPASPGGLHHPCRIPGAAVRPMPCPPQDQAAPVRRRSRGVATVVAAEWSQRDGPGGEVAVAGPVRPVAAQVQPRQSRGQPPDPNEKPLTGYRMRGQGQTEAPLVLMGYFENSRSNFTSRALACGTLCPAQSGVTGGTPATGAPAMRSASRLGRGPHAPGHLPHGPATQNRYRIETGTLCRGRLRRRQRPALAHISDESIGGRNSLELLYRRRVIRIAIRMKFLRQAPILATNFVQAGSPWHAQGSIMLFHCRPRRRSFSIAFPPQSSPK